ncbi:hypothetical protein GC175_33200 [bacterium]|nr:hypothetical protein [bacterium]
MQRIVWLASYPKSGNTWVRIFLSAYQQQDPGETDINAVDVNLNASDRRLFDWIVGIEASDLTPSEIDLLRPGVYRHLAGEAEKPIFVKVHDCWRRNSSGEALFPHEISLAAVYIVRDPRAVAPSLAAHLGESIDKAIQDMGQIDRIATESRNRLAGQLHQQMGSWSQHVASWLDQKELPVHLIRYEDLHRSPHQVFRSILQVTGLPVDDAQLNAAVEQSRFQRLQAQEDAAGFQERQGSSVRFFRRGQVDGWRHELSTAQIARIEADHGAVMARLGYL